MIILYCAFTCITTGALSQPGHKDHGRGVRRSDQHKLITPLLLAKELVSGCESESCKVNAIFTWITENISYRVTVTPNRKPVVFYDPVADTFSLDERVAATVLKNKEAICEGYARLFKVLCGHAGITSEIIHGYASNGRRSGNFGSNHTWNAVMINNEWKLLDVTWASGYVTGRGSSFIKARDDHYYLASPGDFIRDHYPDNLKWSLLTDPPLLPEFRNSPFRQRSFIKYRLVAYSPARGVVNGEPGDQLSFEIETADPAKDRQVGADGFPDTTLAGDPSIVLISPSAVDGNKTKYTYTVTATPVKWLYLIYNNDVVLRYRLLPANKISKN